MKTLLQDLRYAARSLRKSPGFVAVVVLTLALGIGANTAIFSVVNGVLLQPLPYAEPDELARVFETFPVNGGQGSGSVSIPNFRDWREQTHTFQDLAAFSGGSVNLQGVDNPERLASVSVTANLFPLLGVRPRLGRTFLPGEDEPSAAPTVVLSEGLWQRRFAGNPAILGTTIMLDGEAHTVVGVMPAGFSVSAGDARAEVWVPLRFVGDQAESRGSHWMAVVGRLNPGVSLAAAQSEMGQIAGQIAREYPDEQQGRGVQIVPLQEVAVGRVRPTLLILLGAAGLVLLIAAANAANLLLARSTARRRETAIRAALGATRGRVITQFLAEALLLALGGAALGVLLAETGVGALVRLAGNSLPRAAEIDFDLGVFAFLLFVTVLTAVGFGLVPALQATRTRLHDELKQGGVKTSAGPGGERFRSTLVVGQIALSLVLLIGAGLLIKTLASLLRTETGMATESVLTANVAVPGQKYPDGQITDQFYRPVLERVRQLPGVQAAGWISHLPLRSWGFNGNFEIEGRPAGEDPGKVPFAEFRAISPGYFAALGIPLRSGRDVSPQDDAESPPVVLVNQALADRYFPRGNPIGRRLVLDQDTASIIGVVGDVRQAELAREPMPEIYIPYTLYGPTNMTLVVSTRVPPTSMASAIQSAIRSVDPNQPVYGVQTMQQVIVGSVSDRRLYLWLLGTFAGLALVLAVAGIYGVVSYAVAQRTREIGIRLALGAQTGSVLQLVVRQGARLAGLGLLLGVPAALVATRVLSSLLYGVSATDPLIFTAVSLLLGGVALLASYFPARRATRVDPIVALRAE